MVSDGRVAALVGRWHRLARIRSRGGKRRRRQVHRAGCERDRAYQGKHAFLKPLSVPAGSYPKPECRIDTLDHGVLFWRARVCRMASPIGWRGRCMASKARSARNSRSL